MIYILTTDYFLWSGLKSFISPLSVVWYFDQRYKDFFPYDISENDIIFFDPGVETSDVIISLRYKGIFPRLILLKRQRDISGKLLFNTTENIDIDSPLKKIQHIIHGHCFRKKKQSMSHKRVILTPKEACVMDLSMEGVSVRNIALHLGVNSKTVYTHRLKACRKLGAKRVCELLPYKALVKLKTSEHKGKVVMC
ncbi:TPA: hypothetical protein L7M08_004739 [Klebsiella aerogenes]|nr:hypothetical protein [Klebsiella aerogenes]